MPWSAMSFAAICCLLTMAFVIASLIVLSLIPVYLQRKDAERFDINESMPMLFFFACVLQSRITFSRHGLVLS